MRGFESPDDPREDALERLRAEDWLDREQHEHGLTLSEAIEMTRVTGDTSYAMASWDRNRIALAHDSIRDVLDHLPPETDRVMVARLEDAMASLRGFLARVVIA